MTRGGVTPNIALDTSSVRTRFERIKEFSPALARRVRRDFRQSGDEIISEQRAILDGPLPRGVAVVGQRTRRTYNAKTKRIVKRRLNVYGDRDVKRPGRSRSNDEDGVGLREGIKKSLRTRVVITEKRTSIAVRTTNAKRTGATFWQAKRFRHPTFGHRDRMQYQAGMPYFWEPAFRGAEAAAARVDASIDEALAEISD
ncbi:hypothetical protein [Microbacterium sp. 5K110]|jgi:hypothetical protein|uniref:hypothetical protein n=1 Tax=unclassified Microbacterium TaxID=2609290 RepID=UPI0010FF36B0|nr:hypothetical protein [Microbacterium sp. 5K110]TLF33965.1 hypothetical protein FE256_02300 [Microbacterium sp. 5K110]